MLPAVSGPMRVLYVGKQGTESKIEVSINILHVARGDGYFDDMKHCGLLPVDHPAST